MDFKLLNFTFLFPPSACFCLLLSVLYTDIRSRLIPNIITLPAICSGILFHFFLSGWSGGALFALKGVLTGGGLLIFLFVLGGMGGGDVKLMAALGAWLGAWAIIKVFIYGAAAGAVIALFLVIFKKKKITMTRVWNDLVYFAITGKRVPVSGHEDGFPYSVPIAAGFIVYIIKDINIFNF